LPKIVQDFQKQHLQLDKQMLQTLWCPGYLSSETNF